MKPRKTAIDYSVKLHNAPHFKSGAAGTYRSFPITESCHTIHFFIIFSTSKIMHTEALDMRSHKRR
jgi:hypothetical protein